MGTQKHGRSGCRFRRNPQQVLVRSMLLYATAADCLGFDDPRLWPSPFESLQKRVAVLGRVHRPRGAT